MTGSPDARALIQQAMRQAFPAHDPRVARFYQMQEYHLGWRDATLEPAALDPGKLVRPRLALLACQAAGGDPARALPLAAAIQLIHDFSLIHDDIEDNSDTRRGRRTLWNIWGLAQGINAGDGMFVLAHLALQQLADAGVDLATTLDVMRRFDQTILTICEGQFLDIGFEGLLDIGEDDYLAMIERKTAVLLAAAAGLGALVGGGDAASVAAFDAFGRNLGLAFQIEDDILGIWGDPALTGKPFAADLARRKLSLPVIRALRVSHQHADLATLYGHGELDETQVRAALAIIDATDARAFTAARAGAHHHAAFAALDNVQGDAAAIARLRGVAQALVGRAL